MYTCLLKCAESYDEMYKRNKKAIGANNPVV